MIIGFLNALCFAIETLQWYFCGVFWRGFISECGNGRWKGVCLWRMLNFFLPKQAVKCRWSQGVSRADNQALDRKKPVLRPPYWFQLSFRKGVDACLTDFKHLPVQIQFKMQVFYQIFIQKLPLSSFFN